jgi:S-adenosylmethionine decarboxylase
MSLQTSRSDRLTYEASRAWGLSTSIDLYGCDPSVIQSREHIVRFTHQLCELLGVKRFGDTQVVRFGDDPRIHGYSMVQLIETSLVSGHFAEESNAAYLDVFSCRWYDSAAAAEFAREFFRADLVQVHLCQRS